MLFYLYSDKDPSRNSGIISYEDYDSFLILEGGQSLLVVKITIYLIGFVLPISHLPSNIHEHNLYQFYKVWHENIEE